MRNACIKHEDLQAIQIKVNRFIWSNRIPKIKNKVLYMSYENGGLRSPCVINMYKANKLSWLAQLNKQGECFDTIHEHLKHYGGFMFLLKCNYDDSTIKSLPTFYKEIFQYAQEILKIKGNQCIIWNNEYIRIQNKTIYWKAWHESGIVYVQDLLHDKRFMTYPEICQKYDFKPCIMQYNGLISSLVKTAKLNL